MPSWPSSSSSSAGTTSTVATPPWATAAPPTSNGAPLLLPSPPNQPLHQRGASPPRHVVLYFHGGVYVLGDAFQAADLASQVGRRKRATVISVGYRLAPEHPYPAAVDDALAAYQALLRGGTAPSDI